MPLVYGLHDLESIKEQRIAQIGTVELNDRIREWNAEVNRQYDAIMSVFTQRNERWNTNPIARYRQPASRLAQFITDHDAAKPRIQKGYYEVGLPLWRYEDALGMTYEASKKMTIEEFSVQLQSIDESDMNTSMLLLLFSIFYDTNWTFVSTEEDVPDVPVKAFANGDTVEYIIRGSSATATADHYTAQAGAISDVADPFSTIKDTLTQYPGTNSNDRIVTFVGGSTNVEHINELSGFNTVDRTHYTNFGDQVSLVDPSADTFLGMGDEVLGEHESGVLVVRWRRIPTDYLVSVNLDAEKPIGIREDETPALRGLMNIDAVENSGNTLLNRFRRKIGFAPVNRTGVLVHRVGNGTYAPPAPYTVIPG